MTPGLIDVGWRGRYFNVGHVFLQLPLSVFGEGWRGCAWIFTRSVAARCELKHRILQLVLSRPQRSEHLRPAEDLGHASNSLKLLHFLSLPLLSSINPFRESTQFYIGIMEKWNLL